MNGKVGTTLGALAGLAAGAGLMYILDPDRGERRRAHLRLGLRRAGRKAAERAGDVAHAVAEQTRDLIEEVRDSGLLPQKSRAQRLASRARRLATSPAGRVALGTLLAAAAISGGTKLAREVTH
ncbi:MAG: hypothetical protein F9K18_03990 [Thermoanaerobaculia bacterium]|nr:MAG: hypothetical protein F9K18_03990 [Thermoanaerobaculia bacterium]